MAELPLFPIPEIVVFPGMTVPLHIFEERYKHMIRDCIAKRQPRFVMVLSKPQAEIHDVNRPATHAVGAYANLIAVEENADGTFNAMAHGQGRCFIHDIDAKSHSYYSIEDTPYPLERGDLNDERLVAWDTLDTFREYAKAFFPKGAISRIEKSIPDDLLYQASFICTNLSISMQAKQQLLEAKDLGERFRLAQEYMQKQLEQHDSPAEMRRAIRESQRTSSPTYVKFQEGLAHHDILAELPELDTDAFEEDFDD